MKPVELRFVANGDYFHLKNDVNAPLYLKNHYDRSTKKWSISPCSNVNKELFRKSSLVVYVED